MLLGLLLWACQGDSDDDDGGPTDTPIVETDAPTGDTSVPTVVSGDLVFTVVPGVERNDGAARLVAFLVFETNQAATVEVQIDDGGRAWTQTGASATSHRVRILGLKPDATHEIVVTATADDGDAASATLSYQTDPLPDDFPEYTVVSDPSRMEPGVTFAMFQPYVAMVDPEGIVRWYMTQGAGAFGFSLTGRETMLVYSGRTALVEYDIEGNELTTWRAARTTDEPKTAVPVDAEAFHHDMIEMPNGNILALSIERRRIVGFPSSESNPLAPPADAWVAGDVIVEFQRDGTLVNEWRLFDILDPLRIGYDVLVSDYWQAFYTPDTEDWSHANAIWYDAARDEVVVSLRHQDAVVALDHADGALSWIFAPPDNWRAPWDSYLLTAPGPVLRAYHQHSAKITPSGTLMMFDNGNNRASAYQPKVPDSNIASRGAEFVLDHTTGTWQLAWQFGDALDPALFGGAHGDCDPLPQTGNTLVTFGSVRDLDEPAVQIFEVTRTDPQEVVFHLTIDHPYITGRSERVTGLIPGF